jgi:hypothetical protein
MSTFQKGKKTKGAKFTTPTGRASYPSLFTPKLKYDSESDYEYLVELLFDKGQDLSDFKKKCDEALAEYFGANKATWPKTIVYPLVDQEIMIDKLKGKDKEADVSHLAKGAFYARFKTNAKNGAPVVVDQQRNEILDAIKIYGGCYGKVAGVIKVNVINGKDPVTHKPTVTVYVTPYLSGFQLVKDGTPIGGGRGNVSEMFEAVEDDADDIVG